MFFFINIRYLINFKKHVLIDGIFWPTFSFIKFKSLGTKVKIHYKILLNNFLFIKLKKKINLKNRKNEKNN